MRGWRNLIALVVLAASSAQATTTELVTLACPVCEQKFTTYMVFSYSTVGADAELRPRCLGDDIQAHQTHACPACRYAGWGQHFFDSNYKPLQIPEKVRLAIRQALGKDKSLPKGRLFPLEKVHAAEICFLARESPEQELLHLYRLGAWLADDAGEDELAVRYRRQAFAVAGRLAAHPMRIEDPEQSEARFHALRVQPALALNLGQADEADRLLHANRQALLQDVAALKKRVAAKSATRPDPGSAGDAQEQESSPDELLLHDALEWKASLENFGREIEMRRLGEAKAREKALRGRLEDRRMFIIVYGPSGDAHTRAAIKEILANPAGTSTRPEEMSDEDWESETSSMPLEDLLRIYGNPHISELELVNSLQQLREKHNKRLPVEQEGLFGTSGKPDLSRSIDDLACRRNKRVASLLWADLSAHPRWWADNFEPDQRWYLRGRLDSFREFLALDEAKAIEVASDSLKRCAEKRLDGRSAAVGLLPLAFCRSTESLDLLRKAVASDNPKIKAAAIQGLILRGDPMGKDQLLDHYERLGKENPPFPHTDPRVAAEFIFLLEKSDLTRLRRLHKNSPWDRNIPEERRATFVAALAKFDPDGWADKYRKLADETAWAEDGKPTEDDKARRMAQLAGLYCLPEWLPRMESLAERREWEVGFILSQLARGRVQSAAGIFERYLNRPTPLDVKLAIISAAGRVQVNGLPDMLREWSRSSNRELSLAAAAALEKLGKPAP